MNEYGQPVGDPVDGWTERARPGLRELVGQHGSVVPLQEAHVGPLFDALVVHAPVSLWTYLPAGPFGDRSEFERYLAWFQGMDDAELMAIVRADGRPVGVASYLRINEAHGSAEVGGITFAPELQRTVCATEAMVLMARHVFDDLGYRRYEWKCDALNRGSLDAALRLGFTFEGTFRNAMVNKGRNRDTAWLSITDDEWVRIRAEYDRWLDPSNFDADGTQRTSLAARTRDLASGSPSERP